MVVYDTKKNKDEIASLKRQVLALLMHHGYSGLSDACKKHKTDYALIYGQLNCYRNCYTSIIEKFVKSIDSKTVHTISLNP